MFQWEVKGKEILTAIKEKTWIIIRILVSSLLHFLSASFSLSLLSHSLNTLISSLGWEIHDSLALTFFMNLRTVHTERFSLVHFEIDWWKPWKNDIRLERERKREREKERHIQRLSPAFPLLMIPFSPLFALEGEVNKSGSPPLSLSNPSIYVTLNSLFILLPSSSHLLITFSFRSSLFHKFLSL